MSPRYSSTPAERDADVLGELRGCDRTMQCMRCRRSHARPWVTPMMVGGRDASHHSATLARLVKQGHVVRRERGNNSFYYRVKGGRDCVAPWERAS